MTRISGPTLALMAVVLIPSVSSILAAEQLRSDPGLQAQPTTSPLSPAPPRPVTGKERLGEKWTDEQRLDNCNVPIDQRGEKPRPDACPSTASE
jgi:hypothetical protein